MSLLGSYTYGRGTVILTCCLGVTAPKCLVADWQGDFLNMQGNERHRLTYDSLSMVCLHYWVTKTTTTKKSLFARVPLRPSKKTHTEHLPRRNTPPQRGQKCGVPAFQRYSKWALKGTQASSTFSSPRPSPTMGRSRREGAKASLRFLALCPS